MFHAELETAADRVDPGAEQQMMRFSSAAAKHGGPSSLLASTPGLVLSNGHKMDTVSSAPY